MYLEKVKLENFRSFENAEVLFQRDLTILVGENNGGKSNTIDAIRLLTIPLGGRREIYCEDTDVRFHSETATFELESRFASLSVPQQGRFISAATDASLESARFGLRFEAGKRESSPRPNLWAGSFGMSPEPGCHEMIRHVYLPPLRDAKRALASGNPTRIMALLNHFLDGSKPDQIAKALGRTSSHPILSKVDAAVGKPLHALTIGARQQVAALEFSADEALVDIARDLRFKLADHGVEPEDLQYSGHGYANLLYMAIIAVELEKVKSADLTLFLVEEPEAHLHPQLQAAVLCFLQEQAEKSRTPKEDHPGPAGELQVVVATHSPNLSAWVPSDRIVVFKTILAPPTPVPSSADELAKKPAQDETSPSIPVVATTRPLRRASRCIPLAALDLSDIERRKIDRYLDVTKAAFLFGGRILLAEGIAEALLLPVIAKKYVLKDKPDHYRIFRSAVIVPIAGVDFEPYTKLLLTPHSEVCIADRLVVLTDGDAGKDSPEEDNEDDDAPTTGGIADDGKLDHKPTGEVEVAQPSIPAGQRRKTRLEELCTQRGTADRFAVAVNTYSLETELVRAGNGGLMRDVFLACHKRSAAKWDLAVAKTGDAQAMAIQALFKDARKGDFAQVLADKIDQGAAFIVPDYIRDAIEALVA